MTRDEVADRVLAAFRPKDLELLLGLNYRYAFEPGDVVVASGESVERAYLVEQGTLRVDREGTEPRFLSRGQVFGSTGLLLDRTAQDSITAVTNVAAIGVSRSELEWLEDAEPDTAARLWRAVALSLAARNLDLATGAAARPEPHAGPPSPDDFAALAEACSVARTALESLGEVDEDAPGSWARERIPATSAAYRPVMKALAHYLQGAAGAERERRVQLARRELLDLGGKSRLIESMTAQGNGAPGWRLFNHIYRNVPEGDDGCGLLTDAWLLTRPYAEAIRERRTVASRRVTGEVEDRGRPDRQVRILSLGCGPARSLADLLEDPGREGQVAITCVDDDSEALVHANNLLKRRAPQAEINFRHQAPDQMTPDAEEAGAYDFIGSLYAADRTSDAGLVRILLNSYRWLAPGGSLLLVVFGEAVPDWLLLEVLLHWTPRSHTQRELQDLAARSPFGQSGAEVTVSATGLNLFLRAVRNRE